MTYKNKTREKISYKKEKVVLSDILPYEVPVIFNNRYFYRFLVDNKIELKDGKLRIDGNPEFYKLLTTIKNINTIPFEFRISHKNNSYRALSIIHPLNQIYVIDFYNEFKETIKYFSSVSHYSIRKPYKVAKTRFINDYIYKQQKKNNSDSNIEIHSDKEENLKTFFSYKKYSNIHKFFESYEYQRSEKKFNHLYKFDIGKCFDSIYTHSISWAIYNKHIVKDNLSDSKTTFAGKFDKLMQNMNYGETNGILIGSEVSRIFAEILLQQVDKEVFDELQTESMFHKKDYDLYRYVDDYFLFCNDEKIHKIIVKKFTHYLKQKNLYLNEAKSYQYSRPIITELTIAKTKITDLISNKLSIKSIDNKNDNNNKKEWSIGFNSQNFITRFKIIISESNIEYKDIINYSIAVIEKITLTVISKIEKEESNSLYLNEFVKYIYDVLDLVFFIYSVAPRVSTTIKIVTLISKILEFMRDNTSMKEYQKDYINKKIFDEIYQVLKANKAKKYIQNESLYLLIVLAELNDDYSLDSKFLKDCFIDENINYFTITTLLFYIKNKARYDEIKEEIIQSIDTKFNNCNQDKIKQNTEIFMLLLDLLSCPFIDKTHKKKYLAYFDITKDNTQERYIKLNDRWFIQWENFNLSEEMERKKSQEVYS
ncbi:Sll1503 protein [uncultured Candidatus Thioglobus sp.]|nr:Sll1503 protein [uncultured Candidatus Thioglobus sp.]